jgi:hypothetical protein
VPSNLVNSAFLTDVDFSQYTVRLSNKLLALAFFASKPACFVQTWISLFTLGLTSLATLDCSTSFKIFVCLPAISSTCCHGYTDCITQIDLLNHRNFATWSIQVMLVLEQKRVRSIVGLDVSPKEPTSDTFSEVPREDGPFLRTSARCCTVYNFACHGSPGAEEILVYRECG